MQDFTVIEWRGGISVSRRHFSYIPPGYVLLRVYYAAWTGVEEAIRQGVILPRYGVVMGFSGVGRVVEASTGVDPVLSGKYVAPTVVEVYSQMGIDADGFLGEYAVVKSDALTAFDGNPNHLDSLALHASIAYDAITRIESSDYSRILVVGAGVSGLLLSLELAEKGHSVDTYTLKYRKNICGLKLVNRVTPTDYDVVVLMTPMPFSWYFTSVKAPRTLFVHPAALPAYAFSFDGIVHFELLRGIRGLYWRKLIRKHAECLEEHIVNIDVGLVEPPFLGENTSFIYMLRKKMS